MRRTAFVILCSMIDVHSSNQLLLVNLAGFQISLLWLEVRLIDSGFLVLLHDGWRMGRTISRGGQEKKEQQEGNVEVRPSWGLTLN